MRLFQKYKHYIGSLIVVFMLAVSNVGLPMVVYAADSACAPGAAGGTSAVNCSKANACDGIGLSSSNNNCGGGSDDEITRVVRVTVNLLSVIVGIAAVVMIIVSGFRYITSGGESSKVSGAKNALIYAVVGLMIVSLAQFIIHFVLTSL